MSSYVSLGPIQVDARLYKAVEEDILPNSGVSSKSFWTSLGAVLAEYTPRNEALLRERDAIQARIDAWLLTRQGKPWDASAYAAFLTEIGYLVKPDPTPFKVEHSTPIDPEVNSIPGPQLVVPVDNLRFALNAANARWGSFVDALYGTDAGPSEADGCERGSKYNPKRGAKVWEMVHAFLDEHYPLAQGAKFGEVTQILVDTTGPVTKLSFKLKNGREVPLDRDSQFEGHVGPAAAGKAEPSMVVLRHNALATLLVVDRQSDVGKAHAAGLSSVELEAAVTAICDMEDSVAAVDAEDKAKVYKNWTELMRGVAKERLSPTQERTMRPDRKYTTRAKAPGVLKGRALLFVRNVGIHKYTDAVRLSHNNAEALEGIVDLMVSALAARHDLFPTTKSKDLINSQHGNMYLVKPKMHGPAEVAFVVDLVSRVEKELGLKPETIKLGIMDEERRTTVNLRECIRQAKSRCVFINTGFLDRTGDEIHTSFAYGPVLPKHEIEGAKWRLSYEDWNVDIGLQLDLPRSGQIGKGMWAAPNAMAEMMKKKGAHPSSGATTAWVPSPTAATLHAVHYHKFSVADAQARIRATGMNRGQLGDILTPPFLNRKLTAEEVANELSNNAQGILGYVARWVQLGIGCSSVPNIHDVALMEDLATLRISSQHIANWLEHGIVTEAQVRETFVKMAAFVDRQNKGTAGFVAMAPSLSDSLAFQAALALVFRGKVTPNGLTERTLIEFRKAEKAKRAGGHAKAKM